MSFFSYLKETLDNSLPELILLIGNIAVTINLVKCKQT
jgi:hypothetical protein